MSGTSQGVTTTAITQLTETEGEVSERKRPNENHNQETGKSERTYQLMARYKTHQECESVYLFTTLQIRALKIIHIG